MKLFPTWLSAGVSVVAAAATVGLAGPAGAAQAGAYPAASSTFSKDVGVAVRAAVPGAAVTASTAWTYSSALDARQKVSVSEVVAAQNKRASAGVVRVLREVGPQRAIGQGNLIGSGRLVKVVNISRPGAGARQAYLTSSAISGPGLTSLAWNEAAGVIYLLVGRGDVTAGQLESLARHLPRDSSRPSAAALAAIRHAPAPSSPPAHMIPQSAANGYVDGISDPTDDWGNESTLCNGCSFSRGNYALMWQAVLYYDVADFPFSGMDCDFGPNTASATSEWQSGEGLPANGTAGAQTLTTADNFLYFFAPSSDGDYVAYASLLPLGTFLEIHRHANGKYDMNLFGQDSSSEWHTVWYSTANFSEC